MSIFIEQLRGGENVGPNNQYLSSENKIQHALHGLFWNSIIIHYVWIVHLNVLTNSCYTIMATQKFLILTTFVSRKIFR